MFADKKVEAMMVRKHLRLTVDCSYEIKAKDELGIAAVTRRLREELHGLSDMCIETGVEEVDSVAMSCKVEIIE